MKAGDKQQTQEHLSVRKEKGDTGLQEHNSNICSPCEHVNSEIDKEKLVKSLLERERYPWTVLKVLKACLHELGRAQLGAGGFSITVSHRARSLMQGRHTQEC